MSKNNYPEEALWFEYLTLGDNIPQGTLLEYVPDGVNSRFSDLLIQGSHPWYRSDDGTFWGVALHEVEPLTPAAALAYLDLLKAAGK